MLEILLEHAVSFAALVLTTLTIAGLAYVGRGLRARNAGEVTGYGRPPLERALAHVEEFAFGAISYAEEQAHKHLKEHGAVLPGPGKMLEAKTFIERGLASLAIEATPALMEFAVDYIEAKLYEKRDREEQAERHLRLALPQQPT
jgi:hypothetical protein